MGFDELRNTVRGRVLEPGDADFEQAARPWSLAVTQPVAAVAEAAVAEDVAAVVRCARAAGRPVVTQPTGHGAAGGVDDAILLRTRALDRLEIDPDARVARVGAGVQWGRVQAAAAEHGLTGLAGSNPVVGVTGYTLGGGIGWFGRKHGWASNALRAFEIVDADGRPARVTADSDPDLFWALSGGGGDFAVVTGLEFELFPAPGLYGGRIMWPGERLAEVWDAFRALTSQAPDELSVWFQRFQFPQSPEMVAIDVAYLGDPERGRELTSVLDGLGGAVADKRTAMSVADLGDITTEPSDPSPAISRAESFTDLSPEAEKILIGESVAPLANIQVRHLGGALSLPTAGARGAMPEQYAVYLLGLGLPQLREAVHAKLNAMVAELGSHVTGRKPFTFLAPGESAAAAFDTATIDRLRALKRDRDPHNVIRANYPVLG
ncbi:FAD-binding oxidoreductase [Nocardia seriolae]|uniref:FAD-linked oxidase n=2 Tax=Nocardia seriolae TaxID=37332 RepID=A0A0B8N6A2_9NOCA|nr:Mitomycin radical oxidase [Nocardia seriolae]MTJ65944.1 FAD-binding protein [Nocardia seriolae]MTJ73184.1 FAD-binding protein [Nocardia seriolae]MTJ86130.1 FAD-binding protein [Nocardia seriolae]MTK30126.1 FAD-binding protein [Nocardia seriolae]